ncbi:unnamed protein product, partial [Prorocentrum cordatum]
SKPGARPMSKPEARPAPQPRAAPRATPRAQPGKRPAARPRPAASPRPAVRRGAAGARPRPAERPEARSGEPREIWTPDADATAAGEESGAARHFAEALMEPALPVQLSDSTVYLHRAVLRRAPLLRGLVDGAPGRGTGSPRVSVPCSAAEVGLLAHRLYAGRPLGPLPSGDALRLAAAAGVLGVARGLPELPQLLRSLAAVPEEAELWRRAAAVLPAELAAELPRTPGGAAVPRCPPPPPSAGSQRPAPPRRRLAAKAAEGAALAAEAADVAAVAADAEDPSLPPAVSPETAAAAAAAGEQSAPAVGCKRRAAAGAWASRVRRRPAAADSAAAAAERDVAAGGAAAAWGAAKGDAAAQEGLGGEPGEDVRFKVVRALHLQLKLRVGSTYSYGELRGRCGGIASKVARLVEFTSDVSALRRV